MPNVKRINVIVGAGHLYTSDTMAALPAFDDGSAGPPVVQPESALVALDADPAWDYVGGTQEGVEVTYEPDYGEVEVDQLKDAAVLFNQGVSISMNTNLAEATLANLAVAWGYGTYADATAQGSDPGLNLALDTFLLGVPLETPVERTAAVVGRAPGRVDGAVTRRRERVYFARRVISVEGSNHALRKTEGTVFPVSFRLLPDPEHVGSEYGTILDRSLSR